MPDESQISMFDAPVKSDWSCRSCICKTCLMWWSGRCPHGGCYDDHRAKVNPYDAAHPGQPPRKLWSNWKADQAFWCRGGTTYPAVYCEHYTEYQGSIVISCLGANVEKFQDGYMRCGMGENPDCHRCYKLFEERIEGNL